MIYTKEITYVSEYFEKNIIITDNQLQIARLIWIQIRNSLKQKYVQQQIEYLISNQNTKAYICQKKFLASQRDFSLALSENQKSAYSVQNQQTKHLNDIFEHEAEFDQKHQAKLNIIKQKSLFSQKQSIQNIGQQQTLENMKIQNNFKLNIDLDSKLKSNSKVVVRNIQKKLTKSVSKIYHQSFKMQNDTEIKYNLLDENGKINEFVIFDLVMRNIEKISSENKNISEKIVQQLKNNQSRIFIMIKCLAVEYFIECTPVCKNILLMLKQKALQTYKKIDWYKAYTIQEPQSISENRFPTYKINQDSFQQAFEDIVFEISDQLQKNQGINNQSDIQNQKKNNFNSCCTNLFLCKPLIQDYLYSLSLGISQKDNKMFQASQGECLHCSPLHIRSIKCFETNKVFNCCVKAQNFLEINQVEKGLSDNQRLPEWMHVDFQKSHITIKGTPDSKSFGQSRIKIFDSKGYLLRQFDIQIIDKRNFNEILSLVEHETQNNQQKNSLNIQVKEHTQKSDESSPNIFLQENQNSGIIIEDDLDICFQNVKSLRFQTFSKNKNQQLHKNQNLNITL
ncbi:hypothetical protein ABPG72_009067 [Tetrahymena utriculariae]